MDKNYYFISYYKEKQFISDKIFHNDVIDYHPFNWKKNEAVLINWKKITLTEYTNYKNIKILEGAEKACS